MQRPRPSVLVLFLASLPAFPAELRADVTHRVSLTDSEGQGAGPSGTAPIHGVAISGDGQRVAFVAGATNLVPGDTNGQGDVFVRDRVAGTTVRVSVGANGEQGDEVCRLPHISSNGRYVAFATESGTLVPGDTNGFNDVFVHDLVTGETTRESVATGGAQGNQPSDYPRLSGGGEWLAFASSASNLVSGDTNGMSDVFSRHLPNGITRRISIAPNGSQADGGSIRPYVSKDGELFAFASAATNLDPADTNGLTDIYLYSRTAGALGRVDRGPGNPQPDGASTWPTLSADGRYVAFLSSATNWIFGDLNGQDDVYVHDRVAGTFERVSVGTGAVEANAHSEHPWISEDGRYVVFTSTASNLVADDFNGWSDVFVHDRQTGETRLASRSTAGAVGSIQSFYPALSADGRTVAFGSQAPNLVPGDTNGQSDVFVREPEEPPLQYCFGIASCPCANPGDGHGGCANSFEADGAQLTAQGGTNAVLDDLVLGAWKMVPSQPALAFAALAPVNGGAGAVFGDGLRCAGSGVVRLGVQLPDSVGFATYGPGLGAVGGWGPGDRRYFQVWYRDPGGPCGTGHNLTNGLRVDFGS